MAFAAAWAPQQKGIVLDGFAGPGGWSEGIRRHLGLLDVGLEWDRSACETRAAAGHTTIRVDVSAFVLTPLIGRVWGLLMSPPCTKFSSAGKGFGNRCIALLAEGIQRMMRGDDCRQEIRDRLYPLALADQTKANEERKPEKRVTQERVEAAAREDAFVTVLVLEPARYLYALITADTTGGIPLEWAAFEQVPSVLPLWKVYAIELRRFGWWVWTGILNAADYGVPQTRERAVFLASAVRKVGPPVATHSKDPEPEGLFGESRPQRVTMAQALGLDRGGIVNTRGDRKTPGGNEFPADGPSWALTEKARSWTLHTNRNQQADGSRQTIDPHTAPAPALTSKSGGQWVLKSRRDSDAWIANNGARQNRTVDQSAPTFTAEAFRWSWTDGVASRPLTLSEGAVLQSFPAEYPWQGTRTKAFEQIGNAVPPLLAAHAVSTASGIPISDNADLSACAA